MIQDNLPHAATHVRQAKAVPAFFPVVIYRRHEGKTIALRRVRKRPDLVPTRQKIDSGNVQPAFAVFEIIPPPEYGAFAAAPTGVGPLGFRG